VGGSLWGWGQDRDCRLNPNQCTRVPSTAGIDQAYPTQYGVILTTFVVVGLRYAFVHPN
jgi:hypothetical protein